MTTHSPHAHTLTIVPDPVEEAMGLLRAGGLDFVVVGSATPHDQAEAAAA